MNKNKITTILTIDARGRFSDFYANFTQEIHSTCLGLHCLLYVVHELYSLLIRQGLLHCQADQLK